MPREPSLTDSDLAGLGNALMMTRAPRQPQQIANALFPSGQKFGRAVSHGVDQALFGVPSAAVHGVRALLSGDWSGEAQRRLGAKESGLGDLKDVAPSMHKLLMELTSMPVPSNPHSAVNAIAAGAGKMVPAIFAGIGAKTADRAALARAQAATEAGMPREQVWNDHGWFKGPDGKWKWEIDDSNLLVRGDAGKGRGIASLDGGIYHPELAAAYPSMSRVRTNVTRDYDNFNEHGSYDSVLGRPNVTINNVHGPQDARSTAAHEFNHRTQDLEGFATGSSPDHEMINHQYGSKWRAIPDAIRNKGDLNFTPESVKAGWDRYQRSAGEVESRAVEKRLNLTPEQRRARPPWLDYDVPEANQIVRFD